MTSWHKYAFHITVSFSKGIKRLPVVPLTYWVWSFRWCLLKKPLNKRWSCSWFETALFTCHITRSTYFSIRTFLSGSTRYIKSPFLGPPPRLAKRSLKTNGRLANRGLTSLVKEANLIANITSTHEKYMRTINIGTLFPNKYTHGSMILLFRWLYH